MNWYHKLVKEPVKYLICMDEEVVASRFLITSYQINVFFFRCPFDSICVKAEYKKYKMAF